MRQERHFYTSMDAEVIEVRQDTSEVAIESDEIYTEGLGPCIGVAFSCRGRGYMFHGAGMHHTNAFDAFLDEACHFLTSIERKKIKPVVTGGDLTGGVKGDVLCSRRYCLVKLGEAGFGIPQEMWCPDGQTQSLYLDVRNNKARVHTELIGAETSSNPATVDMFCV